MSHVDILIVNALKMEHDAAKAALEAAGVALTRYENTGGVPHLAGSLLTQAGAKQVVLARATRMGAVPVSSVAASLASQLHPTCVAMSGVCAGNPSDVALGDVIVAELAYAYDEGKRSAKGFEGDHRQIPLADDWQRIAQELALEALPSFGEPDDAERRFWFLEQLAALTNPAHHPARERYLEGARWGEIVRSLENEKLIERDVEQFSLTDLGRDAVAARRAYGVAPLAKLPFAVHVGPVASGNAVVKDGVTWEMLKGQGVRTVLGLEMEAAAISQVAHRLGIPRWIVVKGVMDHADPNKDDLFKPFAARASAEVLVRMLQTASLPTSRGVEPSSGGSATNVVGNIQGSNISINQAVKSQM